MPTAQETETSIQRGLTHDFIMAMPTEFVLMTRGRVSDGEGGWIASDHFPQEPQNGKFISVGVTAGENAAPTRTIDGIVRTADFILLCEWDATIGLGDRLDYNGDTYEVIGFQPYLPYEIRALVSRRV